MSNTSSTPSPCLIDLPGEIKNQIFELCILDARDNYRIASKWSTRSGLRPSNWPPGRPSTVSLPFPTTRTTTTTPQKPVTIKVSILPGWTGPGKIKTSGLGPLPLLFVSKEIHDQISSTIDAQVEEVSIGPYGLQYENEDANLRWECAYRLLNNRPHLMKNVTRVKVHLPCLRQDWLNFHLRCLGNGVERKNAKSNNGLTVIPGLVGCLEAFAALSKLEITLVAETRQVPDLKPLLQLYDLGGVSTMVEMADAVVVSTSINTEVLSLKEPWAAAWGRCLLEHRGVALENNS